MRKYWLTALLAVTMMSGCDNDESTDVPVNPNPGTLQFKAAAINVAEGVAPSTVTLTVSRTAGADGAVSVTYQTANGTAVLATDYTTTSGTLNWASGDGADKSFTVAIVDDTVFEEDENFTVTLAAPTGDAVLGATKTATVTINDNDPVPVKLISFNDFHGNLEAPNSTISEPNPADPANPFRIPAGGVEYLSTLVKQLKAQNPRNAVVAAGDLIGASPLISAFFHDEPAIEALNKLGLEFSSVGNHEFDDGTTELSRIQEGGCLAGAADTTCQNGAFPGASFKYLSANVINRTTSQPFLPAYAIKEFDVGNGEKIPVAFIGLVLKNTPEIVSAAGITDVAFGDEAGAANALVNDQLKNVKAIVVLIHEGGTTTGSYNDKTCPGLSGAITSIVDQLDAQIDVVISGHTHSAYNCVYNNRLLTSSSSFGRVLTNIDLKLDRVTGDILKDEATVDNLAADNLIVVNDIGVNPLPEQFPALAKDPAQTAILDVYRPLVAAKAGAVVGRISADLTTTSNGAGESSLGDVIADAQLAAMATGSDPAVVAFMNPGGIRAPFLTAQISGTEAVGQVTYGEAFTVQPFGNVMTKLTLTGAQIKALLEQQIFPPAASPRILQVSQGFAYTWDANAAAGSKVVAGSIKINGVAVGAATTYRITMNNFLADGGDGFTVFRQGTGRVGGGLDIDALIAYFAASSPLAPGPQNRITRLN